jgi:hypothetical protein
MKEELQISTKAAEQRKQGPAQTQSIEFSCACNPPLDRFLYLQRTIGNRAIQRFLKSDGLHAKLNLGPSVLKPKAHRVADAEVLMSGPAAVRPVRQSLCPKCENDIQRQPVENDPLAYVPGATDVPKEYPATASSAAGFDPGAVVGGETASELDQILSNSQFLKPYIQDKLKQKSIADAGKFIVHGSDTEFDMAYMTLHHKLDQLDNPAFRKELELKKGFYWPPQDTIHLRPLSNMSEALHEAIHKFSEMGFLRMFDKFINEGTTQYFADKVQVELGLPPAESHGYGPELVFATDLISYLGESFTAEQYFKDVDALAMLSKLGLTLADYNKKYRFGEDAKARFFRYVRKLI